MKVIGQAPKSTLTAKGQATIPKEFRDYLSVKPGDKLKFFIHPHGHLAILPVLPITAAKGIFKHSGPRLTVEEMREAAADGALARYLRAAESK